MGLRINTNLAANAVHRLISQSQRETVSNLKQLASGDRFADLQENAGDYAVAESLRAQVASMKAARNNAENATSFAAVAEGGLNEQNNILIRMRELAIQSASDTFGDDEREMLDMEFQQLNSEIERIAQSTTFVSTKLLAGDEKEYEFHIGVHATEDDTIKYKSDTNTSTNALGTNGLTISDKSDARSSLESIDEAMGKMAHARAGFGAIQSRLSSTVNNAGVQIENLEAARSRIADTDIAEAFTEMTRNQVLSQYQAAVLAQANQMPGAILKLLG